MKLSELGSILYSECCAAWQAKPNAVVERQVGRADVLNVCMIDASSTFLGSKGTHALLEFVAQHRCVRELRLPRNGVDASCVQQLCSILADGHPFLSRIDLSGNSLSTASARLLWHTSCAVPSVTAIDVSGCGLAPEWENRLASVLASNTELQSCGYRCAAVLRRQPQSFQTVFVLLLGSDPNVTAYARAALPVIASYTAALRVRVAPLTVCETDSVAMMQRKLDRCRETNGRNGERTWCVALVDPDAAFIPRQQQALRLVLAEGPLPPVAPLRDMMGVLRRPCLRVTQSLFAYYVGTQPPLSATKRGDDRCRRRCLTPAEWLPCAGCTDDSAQEDVVEGAAAAKVLPEQLVAAAPPAWTTEGEEADLRSQGDLVAALRIVYAMPTDEDEGASSSSASSEVNAASAETSAGAMSVLRPGTCAAVRAYLADGDGPTGGDRVNVPLVLYGSHGSGKGSLLSEVVSEVSAASSGDADSSRTTLVSADEDNPSVVIFLYRVLTVLSGRSAALTASFASVAELCQMARAAIDRYAGPSLALFVPRVDELDACGLSADVLLAWLPVTLPSNVKIVLSVATESELVSALRDRHPQPLEHLVDRLPARAAASLFRSCLLQRGVHLPGFTDVSGLQLSSPQMQSTPAVAAFLRKRGATTALFAPLAAAYVRHLLPTASTASRATFKCDCFIAEHVPETVEDAIAALVAACADVYGSLVTRCVLGCLVAAPLAVPDLQFVCETLGGCPAQSAIPAVLQLADSGIVTWLEDSCVHVKGAAVREVVRRRCCGDADFVERCAALTESHLHRLVTTRSPEAIHYIRCLAPLMIRGGNFVVASQLLQTTSILDYLLFSDAAETDPDSRDSTTMPTRLFVIDGLLRLLAAHELLLLMAAVSTHGEPASGLDPRLIDQVQLLRVLKDLQRVPDGPVFDLYQCAVWRESTSPLVADAHLQLALPPYPVLVPTNAGCCPMADAVTTATLLCGGRRCHFLHCRPSLEASDGMALLAAAMEDEVRIFDVSAAAAAGDRIEPTAVLRNPLGDRGETVVAALLAVGTRVAVLGRTATMIWDLESGAHTTFARTTVEPSPSSISVLGTHVLALQVGAEAADAQYCIIDVLRKCVQRRLPSSQPGTARSLRRALFCGVWPVLVENNTLYRFGNNVTESQSGKSAAPRCAMAHDAPVESVAADSGGRVLVSSTGAVLWVWMAESGELVHRVAVGSGLVLGLRVSSTGTHFLCEQPHGLSLWRIATGTAIAPVVNPFELAAAVDDSGAHTREREDPLYDPITRPLHSVRFAEATNTILGVVEQHVLLWDSYSGRPLGAYTAPAESVTALAERADNFFVASTGGDVQWCATGPNGSLRSLAETASGLLTSNVLRAGKVFAAGGVARVSVSASSTVACCRSTASELRLFSLQTGEALRPFAEQPPPAVRSAVLTDDNTLLYIPLVMDQRLPALAVYAVSLQDGRVSTCLLPRELVYGPCAESDLQITLHAADDGQHAAVQYTYRGHSRLIVLALRPELRVHCQLVGHTGAMLPCIFSSSFVFSVGSQDRTVRLWSLQEAHKGAERVSYTHPHAIAAVCAGSGQVGELLLLDCTGATYSLCVKAICSATQAAFVAQRLDLTMLQRWTVAHSPVRGMARLSETHICLWAEDGTVAVASATEDCHVTRVRPQSACLCAARLVQDGRPAVALGLLSGETVLARLVLPPGTGPASDSSPLPDGERWQ